MNSALENYHLGHVGDLRLLREHGGNRVLQAAEHAHDLVAALAHQAHDELLGLRVTASKDSGAGPVVLAPAPLPRS